MVGTYDVHLSNIRNQNLLFARFEVERLAYSVPSAGIGVVMYWVLSVNIFIELYVTSDSF